MTFFARLPTNCELSEVRREKRCPHDNTSGLQPQELLKLQKRFNDSIGRRTVRGLVIAPRFGRGYNSQSNPVSPKVMFEGV